MTATPTEILLYIRPGCHLCEDTRAVVDAFLADRTARGLTTPALVERNIEADGDWHRRYMFVIPVLAVGDRALELATKPSAVVRFLTEALGANAAASGATTAPMAPR